MRKLYGIQYRGRDANLPCIRADSAHAAAAYAADLLGIAEEEGNLSVDTPSGSRMFFDVGPDGTVHLRLLRCPDGKLRDFSE